MSSIGPQLPPHLSKRKRTPDDESPESPAAKQRATDRNQDEVDLDSDDEDDYGPSAPAPAPPTKGPIGPSLPPLNTDEVELEDSDDDAIGPSAPPPPPTAKPQTKPSIGPTLPSTNRDEIPSETADSSDSEMGPAPKPASAPTKRVQGPAPPPAALSERPPDPASDSDSDSDDGYGPALPTSSSHQARQTAALAASAARAAEEGAAKPQRDEWMLALPTSSGSRAPDPTKLKSRRFASGPRANTDPSRGSSGGEIASIWTETPEQKRKRLENAVLGRDTSSSTSTATTGNSTNQGKKTDLDAEQAARIRGYTEATRGKSLYEEHQASRKGRQLAPDEEEDDPSKRAFDREKDVRSGGRISAGQRRELMSRAADFGGRFAKGKYL
ncbi:uncharacterized protein F4807DRAFT_443309 [Annulohypoxylon truncatum]|uniref:uncharacterized protein n=1 Tax=Annulohypoxylon truncatum TaxID=327061 RepID=UPI002007F0B9|nr:uncharacterized protein F4807DRAFT_443309 [Annulohypoxylon truncatum]KAI1205444.1 hypothetical protein F4807DRAFT_443309 [Annulohypoxylon truncatum]